MLSKLYSFVHGFTVGTSHKQVKWKFKTLSKVPYMLHLFNVNSIIKYLKKKETKKETKKQRKEKKKHVKVSSQKQRENKNKDEKML